MAFICQHCAQKTTTPYSGSCTISPTKHHVWIAQHLGNYTCQHCGRSTSFPSTGSCTNSPTKHHVYI